MIGSLFKALKLFVLRKVADSKKVEAYVRKTVKKWADYSAWSIGTEVEIIGKENLPEGNCLFVGNHQGYLDIPLILSQIDKNIGFVAKKELINIPILSSWMKEIHCVFMDRENPREAIKSINEGVDFLKSGYSMVIFPEGTRSKSDKVGEFKKGSLKLGVKAEVPIVPITIQGTYKAFEDKNRIKPVKVKLHIDKPIYGKELSKEEQNNLSEIIRNKIVNNLDNLING
jgi:1-acyl-sn-glycerol-3-phosphate acyltransferases